MDRIESILASHGDEDLIALVRAAEAAGWDNMLAYLRTGYAAGLTHGGLLACSHCGEPVEDPAHPGSNVGCHLLDDSSGCGAVTLCDECYGQALAARAKIVVSEGEEGTVEDDSALTDREKALAGILDRHDEGVSRNARAIIASHPRDERRQLHRYQALIDAAAARRGKTIT